MKIQKADPTGIKVLLLAIGLVAQAGPSSASANSGAAPVLQEVLAPASLGGVSLARPLPWQPASAYRIADVSVGYAPAAPYEAEAHAKTDPGIDPIQTAAIIPGVFGSVALSMRNFPVAARWAPVYKAIVDCTAGSVCDRESPAFAEIVKIAGDKGFRDKLSFVNSSINRLIAYRKDSVVYGKLDYWAKPSEILEHRAGDCEDFAILKMAALLRAGIPAQSMSLVVLQDRRRKFFHAVLSVSTGSGAFILDSLGNAVLRDSDLPDYVPLYSFSTDRAWIHGSKSGAQVADIAGGFATVAPGEGSPEPSVASSLRQ
ncbi:transglutaminase-like cysteine peptidase [Mesorhizobium sp. CA18]|uniref:transglutaminase-like cysteine peptidase n=1 Tax=unclassified Mesorhizobium TaxID=325217 RepID=UPI001CCF8737|nr:MULTISPECIES: transglutaminase-like cysteine peptidase [unclassified Mesorhizobium]MBZ9737247.1 transglutaminase-like cysteine peptidase [Mesorhizobium sp. CA9]MBZ9829081.1 transglutaminase-like cysteine peptidase [Mesorhizobium sp. CA18]MBZ9834793.1 transglutaminase-like cysteine peptidase [Mesorhizobium sp. CA2]MBZ9840565.1 transglutaminase-like cysteine peptidase [Mesorhizobium sp. CA3]MBZ9880587.1 transglutaminase-like cysteine peptidase [Mesorhizobium sp. Ca11]